MTLRTGGTPPQNDDRWPRVDWVSERHLRVAVAGASSPWAWGLVRAAVSRVRAAGLAGLVDVTPAYATVLLEFDLAVLDAERVEAVVGEALRDLEPEGSGTGRLVDVPVCYGGECGPDLTEVARLCGMSEDKVVAGHAGAEYVACFVGFMPGFAYLGGLPERLAVSRLERPRVRVPAGSVGIAGEQTGVYPFASPGGWRLIGRTPRRMFDARRERPAMVEMGDRVRFVQVGVEEFRRIEAAESRSPVPMSSGRTGVGGGAIRIVEPGLMTTVQDLGRRGCSGMGVARGGAADTAALRFGNLLVGNEVGAAGLEMTLTGAMVEFERESVVVLTGGEAEAEVDGVVASMGQALRVKSGATLRIGAVKRGARVYLCVNGGIRVAEVLGSASTHLGAGIGGFEGRALRKGDLVELGVDARRGPGATRRACEVVQGPVRVVVSSRLFAKDAIELLLASEFRVAAQSDRVGLRLDGAVIRAPGNGRMVSEGMMWGAVQVPEDGKPIVLMCDHPTTGGYPVIACVAAVDLPRLGQLRPGEGVRFEAIGIEDARAAYLRDGLGAG